MGDPRPSEIELELGRGGRKGLFQNGRMYPLLHHYKQPLIQFAFHILMRSKPSEPSKPPQSNPISGVPSCNGDDVRPHKRVGPTPPEDLKSNKRRRTPDGIDEDTARIDKQAKKTDIHDAKLHGIQALRFACPYFKRDPIKFGNRGACSGPGWESVHRLK